MNQTSLKLYCLSGLGADKRFFKPLEEEGIQFEHIEWIDPLANESLPEYAKRLFELHISEDNYQLIGLSFGGMIAQEMAKIRKPEKLILLSTIEGSHQLPWYLKLAGQLRFHRILSNKMITSNNQFSRFLFGANHPMIEPLFDQIIKESDPSYLRWAMQSIIDWKNEQRTSNIQIHGSKDRLLPIRKDIQFKIKGGGHLMLIDRANEIAPIIKKHLSS